MKKKKTSVKGGRGLITNCSGVSVNRSITDRQHC